MISHRCIYGCRFSLNLGISVGKVKIQKENTCMEVNNVMLEELMATQIHVSNQWTRSHGRLL